MSKDKIQKIFLAQKIALSKTKAPGEK